MTLGNTLLNLLYENDISQKQMAIDLGISPSTLNGYINNRREPDYDTLLKFAGYFHVSCDYLLGSRCGSQSCAKDSQKTPPPLNNQEIKLLNIFRSLTPDQMELTMAQVQLMSRQNKRDATS